VKKTVAVESTQVGDVIHIYENSDKGLRNTKKKRSIGSFSVVQILLNFLQVLRLLGLNC
jgi:hypothetical protein